MTTGYKINQTSSAYFLTFTVVDWVDVFTRKAYRDIIIDSLKYCRENKGLQVWSYIIMSNHMHSIMSAKDNNLSNIIRDFKRHTASKILKAIASSDESRKDWMLKRFEFAAKTNVRNGQHQFWQHDNHAVELTSAAFTAQKLDYIHLNPVRAGFVDKASDWIYSSAKNYEFKASIMEVDLMDINF